MVSWFAPAALNILSRSNSRVNPQTRYRGHTVPGTQKGTPLMTNRQTENAYCIIGAGASGLTEFRKELRKLTKKFAPSAGPVQVGSSRQVLCLGKWVKIICVNVVVFAICLAVLDAALRLTPLGAARGPFTKLPEGYHVSDPELGIVPARNFPKGRYLFRGPGHDIFTNAFGCFDRPVELGANEPYMLAIGDSFTWGYSPLEQKWTSRIERETGVRVLKCGLLGTGTRYQFALLRRLVSELPHPPAVVIHLYDTTDFNDDFAFPNWQTQSGRRIRSFKQMRLIDGHREPWSQSETKLILEKETGEHREILERHSTLYNIGQVVNLVMKRKKRRKSAVQGKVVYLKHQYDFNLMLLDDNAYPFVAGEFQRHIEGLRQLRDYVNGFGGRYALFHTNSFRLLPYRPLVKKFNSFLESFPPFLARMPELSRYLFDPHWVPDGEAQVSRLMIDRLRMRGYLPLGSTTASAR